MKYLILLTIITMIVASLSANAQSNFKPGYLVNLKGDTTKGYIDYQEWNDNPTYFRFKTTAKEGFTLVKPSEVLYFNITGLDAYQSYYGPVSMDRIDRYGHEGRDSSSVIKHIFLKVLLKGPNLTLYCFTDQIKPRFFIKETSGDNSKIRELIHKFYYKNDLPVTDNTFIQQLFAVADKFNLKDVKAINRLQNSEYTESDLVKITAAINHFIAKDLNKKTLYKPVNAFLGIGANIAHFSTNTIQSNAMLNNTSILPQVAGGVDVLLNPNTGQFAIRLEGLISANKYKADFDNATSPYYPLHYSFTQTSVSVIPQIVYNVYNADKLKVYISPGAQICILSYGSKSFYSTNNGLNTSVDPIFTFDNYFITARIKAGLKINNRIDLSVSYQIPELITSTNYARIELSTIGTAFNYYF